MNRAPRYITPGWRSSFPHGCIECKVRKARFRFRGRFYADDDHTHLSREVEMLRPRLVLTYDKTAANFFVDKATALGVSVVPGSPWPSVVGWSTPHRAWGWPLALLAVKGTYAMSHDETDFICAKGAELLAECNRLEQEP